MQWMKVVNYMHSAQDSTAFLKWCNFIYFFLRGGGETISSSKHCGIIWFAMFLCSFVFYLLLFFIGRWWVFGAFGRISFVCSYWEISTNDSYVKCVFYAVCYFVIKTVLLL